PGQVISAPSAIGAHLAAVSAPAVMHIHPATPLAEGSRFQTMSPRAHAPVEGAAVPMVRRRMLDPDPIPMTGKYQMFGCGSPVPISRVVFVAVSDIDKWRLFLRTP